MPIISYTPKKRVEAQHNAIRMLQEKCDSCNLFCNRECKEIFIYSVCGDYITDDGEAMVAIAAYGEHIYAIYAPEYLTQEQYVVFEFLMRDVEPQDKLVVFSKESYDAIMKNNYSKQPIDVQMCV